MLKLRKKIIRIWRLLSLLFIINGFKGLALQTTIGPIITILVVIGFFRGISLTSFPLVLAEYSSGNNFPSVLGLSMVSRGIFIAVFGPLSDIIPLLMKWFKKYGDIFYFEILGKKYVFISEPELLKPVLSSSTNITKTPFDYSFIRPMFNDGLLVSEGDKWRTRRKLLSTSFHFKILEASLETVGRNAEDFVSNLLALEGKPTSIEDKIYLLTLKIICESAMGVKLDTENKEQNEYIAASKICHDSIVYRYLRFWLYPEFIYRLSNVGRQFFKCVKVIHNFSDQVIRNKKELFFAEKNGFHQKDSKKKARNAFLDNLLELDDSNPGLLTESGIKEEVDTFMVAGHNPSATTLKFLHFLLANHPDVQEKLYDEQIEILGDDKRTPTAEELQKMIYLEMVIKEALRIYPSIPFFTRIMNEDLRIDENTVIPAGQSVAVFSYAVHRSKNHWDNPEKFIPERFAPGVARHPFAFLPFSAGPRNCIGQKYAMMELKTIMSTVVRQCWLEPVTTSTTLKYGITLHTVEPIIVKVFQRNGSRRKVSKSNI